MANWKKENSYGDYNDVKQNHKENYGSRRQESIITQIRKNLYSKHIGSKKLKNLKNLIFR